jgi:glycosyltransferase involved in cell wall biosynthesis
MGITHNSTASVSVVIPTFNRNGMVQKAIDSVLKQTLPPGEIIVVDDGSTDGTADALKAYGSRIACIYQENAGVSAARNKGIESSSGALVAFLDSDDQWLPRLLEAQVAALAGFPEAVAAVGNGLVRSGGEDIDIFSVRRFRCRSGNEAFWVNGVSGALLQPVTSGIVIRRKALDEAGWFDADVLQFEDFDLWTRLSLLGGWVFCGERLWIHTRDVYDDTNVSHQYWRHPMDAYRSLLRSHDRLLRVDSRNWPETFRVKNAMGHYRCLMGALALDQGMAGGWVDILRSLVDWPSPRRLIRAAAIAAGWRPAAIKMHSQRLRAERRSLVHA